ncbi:hypothetical protein AB0L71_28960 [Streptomyces sp. NPDC052052]|uniref:hypothetical protein n=1 Tax=Streptomyces sp. NPDC052052 TaxID=3154756 RepID=UPI0034245563
MRRGSARTSALPQATWPEIDCRAVSGKNAGPTGGPAPVRAYIEQAIPDALEGRIAPVRVFDAEVVLDRVADAYRAMDERRRLKVLLRP